MQNDNIVEPTSKTRKELEGWVIAMNKFLWDTVGEMDVIILLRNAFPPYRAYYARRLYNEGVITKEQTQEFVKIL